MPVYIYSGLHPREGNIPVHTFFSTDGGKPVVAMRSNIVIDGHSLQRTSLKEVTFMLNAFQHFDITEMYKTNQEYDYAVLVENLENDSIPDKLMHSTLKPQSTYVGIVIDHNPLHNTYTVGCGPRVFTKVFSNFSCMNPSLEFPSVYIQTCNNSIIYDSICDCEADITSMMDCVSQPLSPSSSCSALHEIDHTPLPAGAMSLEHNEASAVESPNWRQNHLPTKYLEESESFSSAACALRHESQTTNAEYDVSLNYTNRSDLPKCSSKPDLPRVENESPTDTENILHTPMSPEDFEAYKPTISTYEKRNKALYDDEYTVTI